MSWKSSRTITRETIIKNIEHELIYNSDKLDNETLCNIMESLSDDVNTHMSNGYTYNIGDKDD